MTDRQDVSYPLIGDYAFISDCHSSALVSREGSIDWCCMPRIDSPSCFGRLLDWGQGGYCRIFPVEKCSVTRKYIENTLILETTLASEKGEVRMLDFFPMHENGRHEPYGQIVRILEGSRGEMDMVVECVPCFEYGTLRPWLRKKERHFLAMGGTTGLLLSADFPLEMGDRHRVGGRCTVREGERRHFSILYDLPENLDDGLVPPVPVEELDRRLDETLAWWNSWAESGSFSGPERDLVLRSAIVLKGLCNAATGAIAAAATTSVGESLDGSRNWDYRFSWVRDSSFAVRSLDALGYGEEAGYFRRFIERSCAGSVAQLQIMFGVGGERRLPEMEISELEGYRKAAPVRIGNAAARQFQHDVYGELLDIACSWHDRGCSPDEDYWEFLVELVEAAIDRWKQPDQGIWESRGEPRHYVLSKVMCWVAVERGIRLGGELHREVPLDRWREVRDEIRTVIEEQGYEGERGVFIQAFGHPVMDASLLLLPIFGFIEADDERMVRTVAAIRDELEKDGLLYRYLHDDPYGDEGTFLACSFWLAECLAGQGRQVEAEAVFRRAAATGNDLGLFAEEYDIRSGQMRGNFPQALTHLSLIAAAVTLGLVNPDYS